MEHATESQPSLGEKRVFALPSQTGILFVLLILSIIAATIFDPLGPTTEASMSTLVYWGLDVSALPRTEFAFLKTDSPIRWWWGLATLVLALKLLLFPLVLILTLVSLFLKPRRLRHTFSMQDMAPIHPELAGRFGTLARQMGIRKPPKLLWSPSHSPQAFVFGAVGDHTICLTQGMVRHFRGNPAELDAVMAHELGHIANKDVARVEIAEALIRSYFWVWLSILAVQLAGFVLVPSVAGTQDVDWDYSVLISVSYAAVLYLLMNALSRVRQSYADVRAIELVGKAAIDQAVSSLAVAHSMPALRLVGASRLAFSVAEATRANLSLLSKILRTVGPEPDFWTRRSAIVDPGKLLQPQVAISFAAGFIIYRLSQALPLPEHFQNAISFAGILALLSLTLCSLEKDLKSSNAASVMHIGAVLPQAFGSTLGVFAAGMLVLYAQRLASSMALLPPQTAQYWQTLLVGWEPMSLALVWFDTVNQLVKSSLFFFVLSIILAVILWGAQARPIGFGFPSVTWARSGILVSGRPWAATAIIALIAAYCLPATAIAASGFHQGLASAYDGVSQREAAIREQTRAVEWNPQSFMALWGLGNYQLFDENARDAIDSFSKAIEIRPSYADAYNQRGISNRELGEHGKAIADFTKAISLNPSYAFAYAGRGYAYHLMREYEQAIADFSRAIETDPSYALAYSYRGNTYHQLRRLQEAIADFNRAIEIDPNLALAYSSRGEIHFLRGEYQLAIADYTRGIGLAPNDPFGYVGRAGVYDATGENEKAIADFSRAIELNPKDAFSLYTSRGNSHHSRGAYGEAIADYTRAIELKSDDAFAYFFRGNAYQLQEQYQQAILDYTKAIELDRSNADTYYFRGNAYSDAEQYQQAIADYTRAIELRPNHEGTYSSRGSAYFAMGQYQQAIADYTWAIGLKPNDAGTYSMRGSAYFGMGQYQQAMADYTRAIELEPNRAAHYSMRGSAYFAVGQYQQAIADYAKAAELKPNLAAAINERGR